MKNPVKHDFSNHSVIRYHHGDTTEKCFQVIREFSTPGVPRVHGNKHTESWKNFYVTVSTCFSKNFLITVLPSNSILGVPLDFSVNSIRSC